jgi:TPR repeat protein
VILRVVCATALCALGLAPALAEEASAPATTGEAEATTPGGAGLDRLLAAEDAAREAAREAWDAAEAAEAARDAARAELDRLTEQAASLRSAAQEALAAFSAALAARQAAEAGAGGDEAAASAPEDDAPPDAAGNETARLAAEDEAAGQAAEDEAARQAAEQEAARQAQEEEAARQAAEEEAARQAAEEEAARLAAEEEAARLAAEEAARRAAEEEAARLAAEEEAARQAAEASLATCLDIAGPPSAEAPISEAAQRTALQALSRARPACAAAVEALPEAEAGPALYHLATLAQATGEHRAAVRLYQRAADAGETAALTRLGDYYNFGIRPIREDIARAIGFYEEAVAQGDVAAAATLAMMHRLGRGVPRDAERQIALMTQAAEAGYHFAQVRLAQTWLTGEGILPEDRAALGLPDPVRAIPHLAGAARSGVDEAARTLAELYATGAPGLNPNPARQFRWTSFLADKGDPPAMALRAFLIERGIGTAYDPERAAAEYVRALETGGVDPATMRGTVDGVVPPWDEETALAFQRILQERGLYQGALDGQVGPMTLGAARALAGE